LFQRLKLKYDDPLSNFAFKFNLCRYNMAIEIAIKSGSPRSSSVTAIVSGRFIAIDKVGRCSLNL
jgi:hypothetical protein